MKRLLLLFITAVLLLGSVQSTFAAVTISDDSQKKEMLSALGIINTSNDSELVTRSEFYYGLLHMSFDDVDAESVPELLVSKGIIVNTDVFYGDKYITYNDAVAAAVSVLGYGLMAKDKGGYPEGYRMVAAEKGLLKGVSGQRTLSLDRSSVINLFYNTIKTEPCVMTIKSGEPTYRTAKGESILSRERSIYEISGLVEANTKTSLTGEKGNHRDQVTIAGEKYNINGTNAGDFLGMYVDGFVQKNGEDEYSILFLLPKQSRTEELIIDAEDISAVSDDCRKIEYFKNDGNRKAKANISPTACVIYNGIFYDGYKDDDFFVKSGNIRLVENDGDNKYDCVFITSYETMIVDYADYYEGEIFGKYTNNGALGYLKLEKEEDSPYIHYYFGEEEVTVKKIMQNDILTVRRSKGDGDVYADIYICRNTVTGTVTGMDEEENIIEIDGEEYKISKAFYAKTDASGDISVSKNYKFYLDCFGDAVCAENSVSSDYCMFYDAFEEKNGKYMVTYMNDNSEWITAPLAKKVKYNGTFLSEQAVFTDIERIVPQIVLVKCNSEGEIKSFTTAEVGKKGEKVLAKTAEQKMRYRNNPNAFDCNLYIEDDAKVFVIPDQNAGDRNEYYVTNSSFFEGDETYRVTAYDVDEFNFSRLFVVISDEEIAKSTLSYRFFVVTELGRKLNDEGDTVDYVKGSMGAYVDLEYEIKDTETFADLSKGSIIRIHTDKDNKIDYWEPLKGSTNTDLWVNVKVIEATVVANDCTGGKLKINWNGNDVYLRHSKSEIVNIYSEERKGCTAGSLVDPMPGDKVFIRTNWSVPVEILIIRP